MQPDDKLTKDTPIAPPDQFESPREESIVDTDPHAGLEDDDADFGEFTGQHELDLGRTHGALLGVPPGGGTDTGVSHVPGKSGSLPWKTMVFGALLVLWGGYYLGSYNGGFGGDVFNEQVNYKPGAAVQEPPEVLFRNLGKKLFTVNCVQCHQASGLGQPGQFPPLVGSEWVVGPAPKRLTQILLHGIEGAIHVKGSVYNNAMPPWGATFKDKEIAAILTYIRSEWGNSGSPITEGDLAAARKETASRTNPWKEAELLAIPEGPLGGAGAAAPAPNGNQPADANANPPHAAGDGKPASAPMGEGPAASSPKP